MPLSLRLITSYHLSVACARDFPCTQNQHNFPYKIKAPQNRDAFIYLFHTGKKIFQVTRLLAPVFRRFFVETVADFCAIFIFIDKPLDFLNPQYVQLVKLHFSSSLISRYVLLKYHSCIMYCLDFPRTYNIHNYPHKKRAPYIERSMRHLYSQIIRAALR